MCGRFPLRFGGNCQILESRFGVELTQPIAENINITPATVTPIIIRNQKNKIIMANWGLTPHWANTHKSVMFNARAETLDQKPMFSSLLKSQRCIVPASGFYEWQKLGSRKIAYLVTLQNGDLFAMAGLYDQGSFTIITCVSNRLMAQIHPRMPVILAAEEEAEWLDGKDESQLLDPYTDGLLRVKKCEANSYQG